MENKYYPPEIEEFHEGFSHEYKGPLDTKWHKEDFKLKGPNPNFSWFLTEGHFRVKFLDREDIESLGFEIPQGGLDYIYKKSINTVDYFLITNSDYPNKIEIRCSNPSWAFGSFLGTIKNKSELKVLLKQLGI